MTWQPQNLPADHPSVRSGGIGVLIVNLGTPDGADAKSVKRYLGEFLSDKRVVEIPAIAWQPILPERTGGWSAGGVWGCQVMASL